MGSAQRFFLLLAMAVSGLTADTAPFLIQNSGFCPTDKTADVVPRSVDTWTSQCPSEGSSRYASSEPFPAPTAIGFYLSGYPGVSGISLQLENLVTRSKVSIQPHELPTSRWMKCVFVLPGSWVGKPVRVVVTDPMSGPEAWVGFSRPVEGGPTWDFRNAVILLGRTASHFLLLLVPCVALCGFAVLRGVREVTWLGLLALIGIAVPGYAVFWLYLLSARLGHAISFLLPMVSLVLAVLMLQRVGSSGRAILKRLLLPAALVFFQALWILSAGFAYGGMNSSLDTPVTRFSHPLPPDNRIPFLFMEGVRSGHVSSPLIGDWLSSDRPPLATAIAVSQYPFLPQPRELGYTALSVLLQSSWLLAMWVLLNAFGIDRRAVACALAAAMFWGFTLVNSFFVWPKLLAAAYLIAFCAILFTDQFAAALRRGVLIPVIAGALLALAFLAHGGSAFGLIGVALTLLITRRRIPARALLLAVITAAVFYAPWMLYQKIYDPPGDRLLKQHLAGAYELDERTLFEDIRLAYGKLTVRKWLNGRADNVDMSMNHQVEYWRHVASLAGAIVMGDGATAERRADDVRVDTFFYFGPSLGCFELGLVGLAAGFWKRYRTATWRVSSLLWTLVLSTLVSWCLIMYSPGSTSIHQGAYAVNLLAAVAGVLGLWSISPWLAYIACGWQVLQTVLVYGVLMRVSPVNGRLLEGTTQIGTALVFAFALSVTYGILARMAAQPWRLTDSYAE